VKIVLVAIFRATLLLAQPHSVTLPKADRFVLPNGMKLLLMPDRELPLIEGIALVRTGTLLDPPDQTGLARLTAMEMRRGGTRAKTGRELDAELEGLGGAVESGVEERYGWVRFRALAESAGAVLDAFHDVLVAPEFRQESLDGAKTEVQRTIGHRNDDGRAVVAREFGRTVRGTDYGRTEEYASIGRIRRGGLRSFHRRYYVPASVTLAIRGDFESVEMKGAIERIFGGWTAKQEEAPEFPKASGAGGAGTYLAVKKEATYTMFALGQAGCELRDKGCAALAVAAAILGGQGRLAQKVRNQMGNAYEIDARLDAGMFTIAGVVKSYGMVASVKAIRDEVTRLRTVEASDAELRAAKERVLARLAGEFDTRSKSLRQMAEFAYFGYADDALAQYQKAVLAATRADVLAAAKSQLDPARWTLVAAGNPLDFVTPLEALGGKVETIDLTVAPWKPQRAKSTPESLERGRQMLARVQQAVGGSEKLAAVKDARTISEYHLSPEAGGSVAMETDSWVAPSNFRQESNGVAGRFIAYWNGETGWFSTPRGWGRLDGPQLRDAKGDLFRMYFRFLLSDRIAGRTVNAIDEESIEIADEESMATLVIDPETGLPLRVLYETPRDQGPSALTQAEFADFHLAGGVRVPYRMTITEGGRKFADVEVKELQVNLGLKISELEKRP
jgi:zinc protease